MAHQALEDTNIIDLNAWKEGHPQREPLTSRLPAKELLTWREIELLRDTLVLEKDEMTPEFRQALLHAVILGRRVHDFITQIQNWTVANPALQPWIDEIKGMIVRGLNGEVADAADVS